MSTYMYLAQVGFDTAENEPSNICYEVPTPYNYNAWICFTLQFVLAAVQCGIGFQVMLEKRDRGFIPDGKNE